MNVAWVSANTGRSLGRYVHHVIAPILGPELNLVLVPPSRAFERGTFDLVVFQIEDLPEAEEVSASLKATGGVAWFHDLLRREKAMSDPYRREEIAAASGVIVSTPRHFDELRRLGSGASLIRYPSMEPPASEGSANRATRSDRRIVMIGSPEIEHRAHIVLPALPENATLEWLVDEGEDQAAARLVEQEKPKGDVRIISGRSPERWAELVVGARAAVHLQVSVFGTLGPYPAISQAAYVPVLVSAFADGGEEPSAGWHAVLPGAGELAAVERFLRRAIGGAGISGGGVGGAGLGGSRSGDEVRLGRAVAEELHAPETIAGELSDVLRGLLAPPKSL